MNSKVDLHKYLSHVWPCTVLTIGACTCFISLIYKLTYNIMHLNRRKLSSHYQGKLINKMCYKVPSLEHYRYKVHVFCCAYKIKEKA